MSKFANKRIKSIILAATIMFGSTYINYTKGGWKEFVLLLIFSGLAMLYTYTNWEPR